MSSSPFTSCHVLAMPYPGRGHINPMMNLCKQLSTAKADIIITFVVTEEWLGFIASDPKPANVRFATIPNVLPSEIGRAQDGPAFIDALSTKMGGPVERLLDRLRPPPTVIVADTYLVWVTELAHRKNIPLASLWTMSATVLSVFYHFDLLRQNNHHPADLSERGEEIVDYIPGVSSTSLANLPTFFHGKGLIMSRRALDAVSLLPKAQYLLFTSFHDLESYAIDTFAKELSYPVHSVGPCVPYLDLIDQDQDQVPAYIKWLDSQPPSSVLYISLGSFLSVSSTQMDEIMIGVRQSSVRYLAVSRGDMSTSWVDDCLGMVVSWCDQLRVLSHPSVGGFLSHCGWNSTLEAVFAGVVVLTFPIFWDQVPNSKAIVDDWKIGWRVRKDMCGESLVTRGEIAELLKAFMDGENEEMKEMRKRAKKWKEVCGRALAKEGSSQAGIEAFVNAISKV